MRKLWLIFLPFIAFPAFADTEQEAGQSARIVQPPAIRFPQDKTPFSSIAIGPLALSGQYLGAVTYSNLGIGYGALSGKLTSTGTENLGVGFNACKSMTSGSNNVCLGYNAGASLTTNLSDIFIGAGVGQTALSTTSYTIAIDGYGSATQVGNNDVQIGYHTSAALANNSVIMGYDAGFNDNQTASADHVIIGANAGLNNAGNGHTDSNLILIGSNSGSGIILDTATTSTSNAIGIGTGYPGQYDISIGWGALGSNTFDSSGHVAFGYNALNLVNVASGADTAFGYSAGSSITTGTNDLCLGYNACSSTLTTGSNDIVIGSGQTTPASSTSNMINIGGLIYGNNNSTSAPAVSSCGTGSPAIDANANNKSGTVTAGTVATTCTITFAGTGYSSWNHCRVSVQNEGTSNAAYSYTKTAITVTASALGGAVIDYDCDGY